MLITYTFVVAHSCVPCHEIRMHRSVSKSNYIREIKGWWLQLAAHQTADRELLYRVARASNFQRQIAYAAFAVAAREFRVALCLTDEDLDCERRRSLLNGIVLDLRDRPPRQVLTRLYGSCPPGFIGALRRTAPRVQPSVYYDMLHGVFADPERRSEARALMHTRDIDVEVLAALGAMPQPVRHAETLATIRTARDADRIAVAIRLLSTVHPAFADSRQLRAASASGDLRRIVVGAITRVSAPLPQGPVLAGFRRLTTTNELRIKARQFRNCLDQPFMLAACLGGQRSVYEVVDYPVLIEIGRIDAERWVLLGINGVGNKRLPDYVRGTIAARLWRQGIQRCGGPLVACEWDVFDSLADELRGEDVSSLDEVDRYVVDLMRASETETENVA